MFNTNIEYDKETCTLHLIYSIVPVRALRCIEISAPWYIHTSYIKIGRGMKHKHAPDFGYHFRKIGNKMLFKCRLYNDDGTQVFRDCIGDQYHFHR